MREGDGVVMPPDAEQPAMMSNRWSMHRLRRASFVEWFRCLIGHYSSLAEPTHFVKPMDVFCNGKQRNPCMAFDGHNEGPTTVIEVE